MREFLVEITTTVPEGTDPAEVDRRRAAEAVRAAELAAAGNLVRLWRPVGELRGIGVWRAADEPELHEKVLGTLAVAPMDDPDRHPAGVPPQRSGPGSTVPGDRPVGDDPIGDDPVDDDPVPLAPCRPGRRLARGRHGRRPVRVHADPACDAGPRGPVAGAGAHLATADYVGYLTGALAGIALPALVRPRSVLRGSLLLLTATFAAMPATHSTTVWAALRLLAGSASALVSAVLFGATFLGVSTLALPAGAALRFPRSVALLAAGYSVGQIQGPLLGASLLHDGYRPALLLAALVVLTAAAVLRIGFPHHMVVVRHAVPEGQRESV